MTNNARDFLRPRPDGTARLLISRSGLKTWGRVRLESYSSLL